jgi:MFS transporter, DHA3 family, macrolide efflux protein
MKNPEQPIPQRWTVRFFTIWTGQAFSLFGSALVQFALIWWLTQKTGSAVTLTIATLVGMLPQVILGPFAGALVDRWNRRLILIVADGSIALVTLGLAGLFATGQVQVWQVYLALALRSLGGAFHFPAMAASTPLMVPEKQLTRISGMNQTLQGVIGMIAPPVGALLLETLSNQGVLMIDVVTAIIAIVPLFFFSIPQPVRHVSEEHAAKTNLFADVREGFRYLRSWPGLMAILGMAFFLNFLLTPTGSLMPLLITKHFGKGALEFGLMDSAAGLGMILGGLLLSIWGGFKKKVATSMTGIVGIGCGVLLTGLTPSSLFWVAVAGNALSSFMSPITNGPLGALMQANIRPDMQGRVMALVNSVATAMTPLGLLIAGPFSDAFGIRTWYWVAGLITILMGLGGFLSPVVMNVENNRNGTLPESADSPTTAVI